jgi:amidase
LSDALLTAWAAPAQLVVKMAQAQHLNPQDVLEPWTLGLANSLASKPKSALQEAIKYVQGFGRRYAQFMASYDVWLTPVLFSPPPRLGELAPTVPFDTLLQRVSRYVSYTPLQNFSGAPAMSVPLHWTTEGLPVGTQFAAKLGEEATLLSLAYELETARPWSGKRPPVSAVTA